MYFSHIHIRAERDWKWYIILYYSKTLKGRKEGIKGYEIALECGRWKICVCRGKYGGEIRQQLYSNSVYIHVVGERKYIEKETNEC